MLMFAPELWKIVKSFDTESEINMKSFPQGWKRNPLESKVLAFLEASLLPQSSARPLKYIALASMTDILEHRLAAVSASGTIEVL